MGVPPGNRTPLFEANSAARYQRQTIIKQIQTHTGRRLICYVSGSECMISENDTMPFVDLLHHVQPGERVELLLHTTGGSIDAAEKLIRMVRSTAGETEFRIIVPEFAKSAGTLMVLGADRVVMSDMSELGPIDPQMVFADGSQSRITLTPTMNTPTRSTRTPTTSRPKSCLESLTLPPSNCAKP